jgi:hypothetical protein
MKVTRWVSAAALTIVFQALMTGTAFAHAVTVSATAACSDGAAVISYTSADPDHQYAHNAIDISFNGSVVATGKYASPSFSFSGSAPSPSPSGTVIVMAFANGLWADSYPGGQSASVSVAIPTDCAPPDAGGRFTGGGKQIDLAGIAITKGLTIHCDLLLSNNLEINWKDHKFHMEEHMTTIECSDNPNIEQRPPAAPLDTLIGIGIGRYDNNDGYTVEFKLVDAGEPGKNDQAALKIYETANPGNVVLNLPLTYLEGGNLQAHYDQPHKK